MKNKINKWEIWCAVTGIVLGTLFHFTFEWFNEWPPLALIFAVNESVWEHCKLGFWPVLFFSIVEYFFIGKKTSNFFIAKAAQLLAIPLLIITIFYTYTGIIGRSILFIDIALFFITIIISQYISYRIMTRDKLPDYINKISIVVIIVLIIAFSFLTYYPPSIPLFIESSTGLRGIKK